MYVGTDIGQLEKISQIENRKRVARRKLHILELRNLKLNIMRVIK
jgi:phosphopantetheinyl transferase (holo-ACP synthase)